MRLASIPLQVANVALVLLAPAVFLSVRSRLTERIPMHFGLDGRPTSYGSPDDLWALFPVMGALYGLSWLCIRAIAAEKRAAPPEALQRFEALEVERRRGLARLLEASVLVVNAVLALVLLLYIAVGSTPGSELPRWAPDAVVALAVAGLGAVVAIWLPRISRIEKEQRALPGADVVCLPEHGWRAGGLFYYAPEDPAVFVPKRLGIGFTLNFARWGAWLFLVAIPVLLVGLALLLG